MGAFGKGIGTVVCSKSSRNCGGRLVVCMGSLCKLLSRLKNELTEKRRMARTVSHACMEDVPQKKALCLEQQ